MNQILAADPEMFQYPSIPALVYSSSASGCFLSPFPPYKRSGLAWYESGEVPVEAPSAALLSSLIPYTLFVQRRKYRRTSIRANTTQWKLHTPLVRVLCEAKPIVTASSVLRNAHLDQSSIALLILVWASMTGHGNNLTEDALP